MVHNIDFAAACKVSLTDNYSKTVDFPASSAEKAYSFRDNLKEAVRSKTQNEARADYRNDITKRTDNRYESGLKDFKKLTNRHDKQIHASEEGNEKQEEKSDMTIEQMLSMLEGLIKLQQQGEISAEEQMVMLENLKEALAGLGAVQTKAAELTSVLDGILQELKTNGSLTDNNSVVDLASELKAMLTRESSESELSLKAAKDNKTGNVSANLESKNDDIINEKNSSAKDQGIENGNNLVTANTQTIEAAENNKQDTKPKADALANKEAQVSAGENSDDTRAVLNSKVEKVTVSDKENSKQDSESKNKNEAAVEVGKVAAVSHNKPENADMSAIKPEQTIIDNNASAAQLQTASTKPSIVNKVEVINQIVKKAEIVFTDTQSEMKMQLEPESLGKLTLKLAFEKGLITAKFVTESNEVKQIIESSFNELKDMLQEKGLNVQNLSVSVGQENKEYNNNSFQQWEEKVRLNGRSFNRGSYEGYLEGEGMPVRIINPYSVHNGEFDHRA